MNAQPLVPPLEADPYYERERTRYANPITSREHILHQLRQLGSPISFFELAKLLRIEGEEPLIGLKRRLKAMVRDGQLAFGSRKRYCLVEKLKLVQGEVLGHPEGYGFLRAEGGGGDLFLSAAQMKFCLPGDRILAFPLPKPQGRQEATVLEVLVPRDPHLTGRCTFTGGKGRFEPYNKAIAQTFCIDPDPERPDPPEGAVVLAKMVQRPSPNQEGRVTLVRSLGEPGTPGLEWTVALEEYGLPCVWPQEVLKEAEQLPESVRPEDFEGRVDLRALGFVTIDGEDAKDFDDAVYGEPLPDGRGWKVWVAVADVSHYVRPGTHLDLEARLRSTSVYFPRAVIPMLPESLSNGLCSLLPGEARLAFTCQMELDEKGRIKEAKFLLAVIRSRARLTYEEVEAAFEAMKANPDQARPPLLREHPCLITLREAYGACAIARQKRGALDLDFEEVRMQFDPKTGKPQALQPQPRGDSHRLIEELMICANRMAAAKTLSARVKGLYRVHGKPNPSRVESLKKALRELNLLPDHDLTVVKGSSLYQSLLNWVHPNPAWPVVQSLFLKAMKPAVYQLKNEGHFGLALPHYTHFTSPIRRYPDLLQHRILKSVLERFPEEGRPESAKKASPPYTRQELDQLAQQCTLRERRADLASREVLEWLKCELVQAQPGTEYDGWVCGIGPGGLGVWITPLGLEGFLPLAHLPSDRFKCDPTRQRAQGDRYLLQLGTPVRVKTVSADPWDRKVILKLSGEPPLRAPAESSARTKPHHPPKGTKPVEATTPKRNRKRRGPAKSRSS